MSDIPSSAASRRPARARLRERLLVLALRLLAPLVLMFIVLHILWGMAVAMSLFPVLPARVKGALVQFWSRVTLVALGIRLEVAGQAAPPPPPGALLVMNHISWADVFVVAALVPARYVAKAEIARWPVLGRFAAAVGTIYVERGRRHAVARVNHLVAARLRSGQMIGVFPEGTTTDGSRLMRFHANLLQAGLDAGAPVVPVALEYLQDGERTDAAAFVGDMNLVQSLWRILAAPRLAARISWLPALDCAGQTRHAVARRAHAAIAGALHLRPDVLDTASDAVETSDEPAEAGAVGDYGAAPPVDA